MGGMTSGLLMNIFWNQPSVHLPASAVTSTPTILDVLKHNEIGFKGAFIPPSMLEEMSQSSSAVKELAKLDFIWYAGGPLPDHAGNIICKQTSLSSIMGSTESGMFPIYSHGSPLDFAWFRFRPDVEGVEFRQHGSDLYELIFVRGDNISYQSTFMTFSDANEYPTKDLYMKHPSKPGYWKHVSRTDDVIVLSNGEKVVSIPIEDALREAPDVQEVVVLGHGRFQIAALIELHDAKLGHKPRDVIGRLSAYIKHANDISPGHARLEKDRIMFVSPGKPMVRTGKNTVIRKATLALYDEEINRLYAECASEGIASLPLLKSTDKAGTEKALLDMFAQVTEAHQLSVGQDFFGAGMDSVQVLRIVRQLKARVENEFPEFASAVVPSLIYSNPTVKQLSHALHSLSDTDSASQASLHARKMEDMLGKYTEGLNQGARTKSSDNLVVILTGSTGALGSYLLDVLMAKPNVSKVYALNRSVDGHAKQPSEMTSRGLTVGFEEKVVFLKATLGDYQLGLDSNIYEDLVAETSVIIHNSWPVDFNLSLDSFEPHIRGTRNLIDLSSQAPQEPPIFYTSSISTAGNWGRVHPGKKIPEQVIGDMRVPLPIGYGESKYISEQLLAAAGKAGIDAGVCRVGQMGGPVERGGAWKKQEWLPSLITSSKYLKILPNSLGTTQDVDWVPIDKMANIIVELIDHNLTMPIANGFAWINCYNLVNPHISKWSSLIPAIQRHLPEEVKVVPYETWLEALRESFEAADADPVANPGIKLLDFYEGLAKGDESPSIFATDEAVKASPTMASLTAVSEEWMEIWMKQWAF